MTPEDVRAWGDRLVPAPDEEALVGLTSAENEFHLRPAEDEREPQDRSPPAERAPRRPPGRTTPHRPEDPS
jgi:hypothetical protein